ncbi:nuclear transport factor 2 family protein [Streptomyces sp. MJP52]|uniref:nuclear transport factor 2 family protein n=1 Tax=Streptomyces sp. MJP52 TaxID=2940555 RepID=UPI0024754AED|nr:nuclear transport factor 2 family protein [Streptomyces sp. MJP52]MDH6227822.1 hypothetical protein [Streptomyces sp. MJP52]
MIRSTRMVIPLALAGLLLTGCGSSSDEADGTAGGERPDTAAASASASPESTPTPKASPSASADAELKKAVQAYSDAFLTGDTAAYDMLSERCRKRTDKNTFTGHLMAARTMYGNALPMTSYKAEVSGDMARVTYTYEVSGIDQESEPWVEENGVWRQDDC